MKKTIFINILVVFLMLAVLEVSARIYFYYETGSSTAGLSQKNRHLDYQPFTMWGADLQALVSAYEFREDTTYRILLVGGSTARAFSSRILEQAFQQRHPEHKFEVINLAYGGYNARQEVIVASIWGMGFKPDLLLSVTGGNDLVHRLRMQKAGTFYLNPAYEFILTNPYITPAAEILRNSQLVNGTERFLARKKILPVASYEDAIPILQNAQHSLNLLANGACIERIMVLQPYSAFKNPLSRKEVSFIRYKYREPVVTALYDKTNESLTLLAEADQVMYLDGRNIYDGIEETIFRDDLHFEGRNGYKILADNIAKLVTKQQLNNASGCR